MLLSFFRKFLKRGKLSQDELIEINEGVEDAITEELKALVNYFYFISRELAKIEHNASASDVDLERIKSHALKFDKAVQRLNKIEPSFHAYWNNFNYHCQSYLDDIKKIIPSSLYAVSLNENKIEKIRKMSSIHVSEFIALLSDVKAKLNKEYKKTFDVSWPKRKVI